MRHGWIVKPLAAVGAMCLMAGAAAFTFAIWPDAPETAIVQQVGSPNQEHVAAVSTFMSGGGAGSCRQYVFIEPTTSARWPTTFRLAEAQALFSAPCQSGITLSWTQPGRLLVRFTVPPGSSGADVHMRQRHMALPVDAAYEVRP